jgi:hypothetical protein
MDIEFTKPTLVEPGIKYFIGNTLVNCANYKKKYYNDALNILVGIAFVFCVVLFLYYKYKGRLSPGEKMLKDREKKHYILSRIKNYQDARRRESQENISGIPFWKNEYDKVY